jgi:uncharacterized protein YodC (DUF2158 family)
MTFEPGQVVTLKSSSQPMTVVAVAAEDIDCVWIGDEGEFFRETIPAVALTALATDEDDHEDDADDGEEEIEAEGEADDTGGTSGSRRRVA